MHEDQRHCLERCHLVLRLLCKAVLASSRCDFESDYLPLRRRASQAEIFSKELALGSHPSNVSGIDLEDFASYFGHPSVASMMLRGVHVHNPLVRQPLVVQRTPRILIFPFSVSMVPWRCPRICVSIFLALLRYGA